MRIGVHFSSKGFVLASAIALSTSAHAWGACGTLDRTWSPTGGQTSWSLAVAWSGSNVPDSATENAIIRSSSGTPNSNLTATIGCLDIQSGFLNASSGVTLTITGDYFQNPNSGSLTVAAGSTWTVVMGGTGAQTFENQDTINYLTITNNSSVTFNRAFNIRNTLALNGTGTTLYVNGSLSLQDTATPFTIPASATVEVGTGATLTALGGIVVNGTLKLNPGASVSLGSGKTLQVNSAGLLELAGASGNVATLKGDNNNTYSVNIAGSINANYFRVNHLGTAGLNVTGTIQRMQNGEFHYLSASGYAVTLGAAASVPASLSSLGFFNDASYANVKNFDATSYAGAAISLSSWIGGVGGATYETDPSDKISWGAQAGTKLTLSDATASGNPPTTIGQGVGPSYFATFAFNLTQADTATDITSITFTLNGTATSSEVDYIQVYKDAGAGTSCVYNAGVDTQIGSNLTLSGSPATGTLAISSGTVTTDGSAPVCVHVLLRTSATAQGDKTIGLKIAATADVSNSQSYSFSDTSGPPVSAGTSTTVGSPMSTWSGRLSTAWATANNWIEAVAPSSARDCKIGSGDNAAALSANVSCQNATLQSGGTLSFGGGAWELAAYGSLTVSTGYTFSSATSGVLAMRGTGSQSLKIQTTFPGSLTIANTGAAGSNIVNVDANSTVTGSVTISSGVLRINSGYSLTVGGSVTVASGGTLDVEPGASLILSNGSVLTVNSGGTLQLIGSASQSAVVTSTATTSAYTVNVSGTIQAQYYSFSRLGTTGVTINSGATIDSTYHLQNCSFSYPVPNSATFLRLYRQIPTDTLSDCSFDAAGSAATGTTNIYTDSAIASDGSDTLTLTSYTGGLAGSAYDNDSVAYALSWSTPTNTVDLTQEATGPASVNQGQSYTMGRFGFKQNQAGAFFQDADLTSLKLTLTGTGTSSDVSQVRIYFDSDCDSSAGTLIGTGTFSGSPATVTFTISAGAATIPADATSPAKRCVYVVYDIATEAVNGNTVGVKINSSADVVNSRSYAISGTTPPPVSLGSAASIVGTSTTWTGAASTDWFAAGNWNGGVPTSSLNCRINSATNSPVIASSGAVCKTVTIGTGTLTMTNGASASLDVYGGFANTGTFVQNDGILRFRDSGTATNQTIASSTTLSSLTFNKTAGGSVSMDSTSLTVNSFTMPSGSSFEFRVPSGKTLTLTNGATISAGTFKIFGGGTVQVGNAKTITVNGGIFKIGGTNDVYAPESGLQSLANKGTVTISGSGRWGFSATSGSLDLIGFIFDYLDASGLQVTGSTSITTLNGGQFTHLAQDWATPVKAIQLNTTGTVPATATNVGFMWDDANSYPGEVGWCNCAPSAGSSYYLVYAPACGGSGISFDQWFGDFFVDNGSPVTESKIYDTDDGGSCQITMAASASPVSMMSLQATGYDGAVSVDWITGSELDHSGFNVYRSASPDSGYIQINPSLIRNFSSSTLGHGRYRFVDTSVQNGRSYFYRVEDVATNGTRTFHGPVSATPRAGAGPVPSASTGTNSGSTGPGGDTGNAPSTGAIANGSLVDLGNGVHILARSRRSLRLEIVPPAGTLSDSPWNPAYRILSVPGYSSTLEPGKPELVERTILLEVDRDLSLASVSGSSIQETLPVAAAIAPAPSWTANGSGTLVPSWQPDAAAYAIDHFGPSGYFELASALQSVNGRNYLKLKISPYAYNPAAGSLKNAVRIVLDIGLDGAAWAPNPPAEIEAGLSPSAVENTLRIRYRGTGMYRLAFDDLSVLGLEGPFRGADTASFRLYHRGIELPLEVRSASGAFSSGDSLLFYAVHSPIVGDDEDEVVLSRVALAGSAGAPLRVAAVLADPAGYPESDEPGTYRHARAEVDAYPMFDGPLAPLVDHLYWERIWAEKGRPATAAASLLMPIELPKLDPGSPDPVILRVFVKGGSGFASNPTHHLGVMVNNVPFIVAEASFSSSAPTELRFEVPAIFFFDGRNRITVQALADLVPDGDFDVIYVDRVEAQYRAYRAASDGAAELVNYRLDHALSVTGFTDSSSLAVYDVTDITQVRKLVTPALVAQGDGTFEVRFAAAGGPEGVLGRRFVALQDSALRSPSELIHGRGSRLPLRSSLQGADLIVVGELPLLAAASELITARESEGLRVVAAPLEQIYAEFSHGRRDPQAIRDLVRFARASWQAPAPRYLLILGDATYDPLDRLGFRSSRMTMNMPLDQGLYMDFGSDHWFVQNDATGLPDLAVGRVPSDDPAAVLDYVRKLLEYENGARAPSATAANQLVFVSGADTFGEGFGQQSSSLASAAVALKPAFQVSRLDRTEAGSDAALRAQILDSFGRGPLAITYLGHGAEDRWAAAEVFSNADASGLENTALPIVLALNCLNAYFYDADPAFQGLGENLLLNRSGGAIAFWGSTTLTVPTAQVSLARAFLDQLAQETRETYRITRVGDLVVRAKNAVGLSPATADTIRSYTLIGDPTLKLPQGAFAKPQAAVPSDPAPVPVSSGGDSGESGGGGLFGCGTFRNEDGNRGGPPSAGAIAEFGLFLSFLLLARFATKRGRKSGFGVTA
ncbi:MAG: C25 family cysteine peptidase [Oligoflexia bacterium]|nr:C25 family cysteine peptidase [Oligoflexia bacterium]